MIRLATTTASFASLLLTAVSSYGQFEVTHPALAGVEKSASTVTADRRHMVAVLSGTTPSALTVYRQVADQPSVAWDAVTSFALDSQAPYHYRVKSGKSTTWVAWQGEPTSGVDLTFPGRVTALRPSAITDADGNGYTRLEEDAFLMPGGGSTANAPAQLIVTVDGKRYPAIRYFSSAEAFAPPANPFTNGGYQYTVEISTDLLTWSTAPSALVHHQTDSENPEHTMSIWRSNVPLDDNPKQFLRMRVNGPD